MTSNPDGHNHADAVSYCDIHCNHNTDNNSVIDLNCNEYTRAYANALANSQPNPYLYANCHPDRHSNVYAYNRPHLHIHASAICDGLGNSFTNENSHTDPHNNTDLYASSIQNSCHHCNICANSYPICYGFSECYSQILRRFRPNLNCDTSSNCDRFADIYAEPRAVTHTHADVCGNHSLLYR